MAQLDVQPKKSNPWWIWLLVLLIAIIVLFFVLKGSNKKTTQSGTKDSTGTATGTDKGKPIAAIAPTGTANTLFIRLADNVSASRAAKLQCRIVAFRIVH